MPTNTQSLDFNTVLGTVTFTFTNDAQLNQMWGNIASQFGQSGTMGEHTSEAGVFTPDAGEGGRAGVGNLSNDDVRFDNPDAESQTNLADGGNGLHAVFQAARLGDPNLPDGAVEATIGPFFPETHGNLTFSASFEI